MILPKELIEIVEGVACRISKDIDEKFPRVKKTPVMTSEEFAEEISKKNDKFTHKRLLETVSKGITDQIFKKYDERFFAEIFDGYLKELLNIVSESLTFKFSNGLLTDCWKQLSEEFLNELPKQIAKKKRRNYSENCQSNY